MTKFRNFLFSFMGLCFLAALPLAYAQDAQGPDGGALKAHMEKHIQEIFNQLGLTDDQKKQLETNKKQHREEMGKIHQEMEADEASIRAELMKAQLDMPKITEINNSIKALKSKIEDDKLASILAVRAILTPEQFIKLANLMRKHNQVHAE